MQLVVQTAVAKFVEWMADPQSNTDHTAEAFALVPADLTRTISLRHTVDMVRVAMEYFEQVVPLLPEARLLLPASPPPPQPGSTSPAGADTNCG